jgi:hypothetical protein
MSAGELEMKERILMSRIAYSILKERIKEHECGWSEGGGRLGLGERVGTGGSRCVRVGFLTGPRGRPHGSFPCSAPDICVDFPANF